MKKAISFVILISVILFSLGNVFAITGSMGNSRMIVTSDNYPELAELNGKDYVILEKTILVKNVNEEELRIELKTDENGAEFLEVVDSNFTLRTDEERKARFKIRVLEEGTYTGKINVFFSVNEETNKPGIVLSSDITVIAKGGKDYVSPDAGAVESFGNMIGKVIGGDEEESGGIVITLMVSTALLLVITLVLLYLMKKKEKNNKNKSEIGSEKKSNDKGLEKNKIGDEKKDSEKIKAKDNPVEEYKKLNVVGKPEEKIDSKPKKVVKEKKPVKKVKVISLDDEGLNDEDWDVEKSEGENEK